MVTSSQKSRFLTVIFAAVGPGMVVMRAETDVGGLVTAAQAGARWLLAAGCSVLADLGALHCQELTARLGTVQGERHGELIREYYGPVWA